MFDVQKIRKDFPILDRKIHGNPLVYFDIAIAEKPVGRIELTVL